LEKHLEKIEKRRMQDIEERRMQDKQKIEEMKLLE